MIYGFWTYKFSSEDSVYILVNRDWQKYLYTSIIYFGEESLRESAVCILSEKNAEMSNEIEYTTRFDQHL